MKRDWAWAYLFIAPQIVGMLAFGLVPMIAVLVLSFGNWDLIHAIRWVGLNNYSTEVSDPIFWKSVKNTIYYTGVFIPASLILALLVALVLNRKLAFRAWYRAIFFMPVITPTVAVALAWTWLLNPDFGLVNILLSYLGINGPQWYASLQWAMPSVILVSVWRNFGYSMVIFLAGLQGVPSQLYEAAQVDGASRWAQFWHITLPMLSPTTFFLIVTNIISSLQVFDQVYMMTGGQAGPADATRVIVFHIYALAFRLFQFGQASAATIFLFIVILLITLLQFRFQRWVHY
ncbi:MAG TPA: sugar ABC transporter permease [Chloroflexota bacterium]|nr:sugar ABC transporter permease [Chloroflexota bacterium]